MGDGPRASELPNPPAAIGSPDVAHQAKPIDWFNLVTQGNLEKFMPGFSGSLDDRQRWDVVAYAFSLSTTSQELEQGKTVYNGTCAACHGENGSGDGPDAAALSTKPAAWTDQARLATLSADDIVTVLTGGKEGHPNFSDKISEDQRYPVAAYVRSLSYASAGKQVAAVTPQGTPQPAETPSGTAAAAGSADSPLPTAEAPGTITINGKVTNGTPGGALPAGSDVTLTVYGGMDSASQTSSPVAINSVTTQVGADGSFVFEKVEFQPSYVYVAEMVVNGVIFDSDVLHGSDVSGDTIEMAMKVFDTTTDTSTIRVDRLHIFFDFSNGGTAQVINLFVVSNNGDKVVVAEKENDPVLRFSLPKGATNLMFQDGELGGKYVQTEDGFGDRMYVSPGQGQYQVLFAYDMPYDKKLSFDVQVPLPVDAVTVMIPPMGVKVKSDQLIDAGQRDMQGMSFQMFQATTSLAAGDSLHLNLSGKVGTTAAATENETTYILFGAGALALALIGAGLWIIRQRRDSSAEEEALAEGEPEVEGESSESILDTIVTLDDLHANGKIPEEAYQERRAELKARLAAALEQEKGKE
jgi:mono/diheme cytochrome c family protein